LLEFQDSGTVANHLPLLQRSASFPLQLDAMVGGTLARASALYVGFKE